MKTIMCIMDAHNKIHPWYYFQKIFREVEQLGKQFDRQHHIFPTFVSENRLANSGSRYWEHHKK